MPDAGQKFIADLLADLKLAGFDTVQVGMRWRVSHPNGGGVTFLPHRLPKNGKPESFAHGLKSIGFDFEQYEAQREADRKAKVAAAAAVADRALEQAQAKADAGPNPADVQAAAQARAEADMRLLVPELLPELPAEAPEDAYRSPFASPPGTTDPRTDRIEMDAEFAGELLKANNYYGGNAEGRTNRKFSEDTAARYAAEMVAGRWQLNHQGIGIDIEGALVDGQHRLAAVIMANEKVPGIRVPMMVTYDLPIEAGDTVDQGLRRQVAHILSMRGEANTYVLAGALRLVAFYDSELSPGYWSNFRLLSGAAGEEELAKHPEIRESVKYASRANNGLTLPTALSAAHYLIHAATPDSQRRVVDEFFAALRHGENLDRGHPVLALRENLMRQKANARNVRQRSAIEHFALVVKAFNATARGEKRVQSAWRNTEPLPRVVKLG